MKAVDGGPAFPAFIEGVNDMRGYHVPGMDLRDYFAAQALAIVHHSDIRSPMWNKEYAEKTAQVVYAIADAMLKERAKGDKNE